MEWLDGKHNLYLGYARFKVAITCGGTIYLCHIFIILIASCISTKVAHRNLSIIVSIGMEFCSSLSKFKRFNT